ncbi:MAG: FAD-binding domain-containing protein [Pseudomonadota bacterium]
MHFTPTRAAGLDRLAEFLPRAGRAYANNRNHDDGERAGFGRTNVSQLSPWLHTRLLGEAEVIDAVLGEHSPSASEKFIAEVFWRIYFKGYLEQRPSVWRAYCDGRDKALAEVKHNAGLRTAYDEATEGRTGIDTFDHWARELVDTGYLHNHARMWFASIWIFTLKLDWQLGADFFLRHLIDGDAASNTLSWRWVGGLHTKGKTYLARQDNIARYTANHPDGPFKADGLADDAPALFEENDHARQTLELPRTVPASMFEQPYALLLHDEAASHVPLDLPAAPALIIGAARPDARSPDNVAEKTREFANEAISNSMTEAAHSFGCEAVEWSSGDSLSDCLMDTGVERIAIPYLPIGWTRDALMPELAPLVDSGRAVVLLNSLDRATWPHAKAGFFGVKKKIEGVLGELGISGENQNAQAALPLN